MELTGMEQGAGFRYGCGVLPDAEAADELAVDEDLAVGR